MKKLLAVFMSIMLLLVLASCSGGTPTPTETPVDETPTETPVDNQAGGAGDDSLQRVKDAGKIVMVTSPDYPPYEFIDPFKNGDSQYVGFDIELGRYIAQELGVELVISPMDFDATLAALGTKQCDMGISGYSPDPERMESMDFSDIYYLGKQAVMIRAEDADKYKEATDLAGKKVAAQNGSIQQMIAEDQLPDATLELYKKVPDEVMALETKLVEAVVVETPVAEGYIQNNIKLALSEISVEANSEGSAIAVPKGSETLLAEINRIIKQAADNGLISQWVKDAQELSASQAG